MRKSATASRPSKPTTSRLFIGSALSSFSEPFLPFALVRFACFFGLRVGESSAIVAACVSTNSRERTASSSSDIVGARRAIREFELVLTPPARDFRELKNTARPLHTL